jgi:hypothetical protein
MSDLTSAASLLESQTSSSSINSTSVVSAVSSAAISDPRPSTDPPIVTGTTNPIVLPPTSASTNPIAAPAAAPALPAPVGLTAEVVTLKTPTATVAGAIAADALNSLVSSVVTSSGATSTTAGAVSYDGTKGFGTAVLTSSVTTDKVTTDAAGVATIIGQTVTNTATSSSFDASIGLGSSVAISQSIDKPLPTATTLATTSGASSTSPFGTKGLFGEFGLASLEKASVGVVETPKGLQVGIFAEDGVTPVATASTPTTPATATKTLGGLFDSLSTSNLITPEAGATTPSNFQQAWGSATSTATLSAVNQCGLEVVSSLWRSLGIGYVTESNGETRGAGAGATEASTTITAGDFTYNAFLKTMGAGSFSTSAGKFNGVGSGATETGDSIYQGDVKLYESGIRTLGSGLTSSDSTSSRGSGSGATETYFYQTQEGSTSSAELHTLGTGLYSSETGSYKGAGSGATETRSTTVTTGASISAYTNALGSGIISANLLTGVRTAGSGAVDTGATISFNTGEVSGQVNAGLVASGAGTFSVTPTGEMAAAGSDRNSPSGDRLDRRARQHHPTAKANRCSAAQRSSDLDGNRHQHCRWHSGWTVQHDNHDLSGNAGSNDGGVCQPDRLAQHPTHAPLQPQQPHPAAGWSHRKQQCHSCHNDQRTTANQHLSRAGGSQ